ncbi:MAG: response regulator [Puniceicoccales bacterium]
MSYNSPNRILLVEPIELLAIGVRTVVQQDSNFSIIAETADRCEAVALYNEHKPDLVLTDLMLPDGGGIDLCRELRKANPRVRIVVLSSCNDSQCMLDAFSLGVDGYLEKTATAEQLLNALREVAAGRMALDPSLTDHVVSMIRNESESTPRRLIETLSKQERRVLVQVAKGQSNKQVADALELSEKTVKNYFSNVMKKLEVSRRTEAAAMFWNYEKAN